MFLEYYRNGGIIKEGEHLLKEPYVTYFIIIYLNSVLYYSILSTDRIFGTVQSDKLKTREFGYTLSLLYKF